MTSFLEVVYSASVEGHGVDTLCWKWKSKGVFYVNSFYRCLNPPFYNDFSLEGHLETQTTPTGSSLYVDCCIRKDSHD